MGLVIDKFCRAIIKHSTVMTTHTYTKTRTFRGILIQDITGPGV